MHPMTTAPRDGEIMIMTAFAAHRAHWDDDPRFQNFWSMTSERALDEGECLGWMSGGEWAAFVSQKPESE